MVLEPGLAILNLKPGLKGRCDPLAFRKAISSMSLLPDSACSNCSGHGSKFASDQTYYKLRFETNADVEQCGQRATAQRVQSRPCGLGDERGAWGIRGCWSLNHAVKLERLCRAGCSTCQEPCQVPLELSAIGLRSDGSFQRSLMDILCNTAAASLSFPGCWITPRHPKAWRRLHPTTM